jgi:7-carboxy-7-deazaguanine synthase|tara:strand:- start:3559 stop:4206 length:648 start_codon:yes stop_codon:yes gene_type:complete
VNVKNQTKEQQALLNSGKYLPIMEEFYTIQGEGDKAGKPAYFIRIGGCDVGCHWCDVKESWDASIHPLVEVDSILDKLKDIPSKDVVITGGEPTMYNLDYLCNFLHRNHYQTYLETSGAHPFSGRWNWICLSPKKTIPPKPEVYSLAHELKVIIHNKNDFKWAEEHAELVNSNCRLFLQPEWSKLDQMMPLIVDYVMANPKWNVSLQTHKVMHIP